MDGVTKVVLEIRIGPNIYKYMQDRQSTQVLDLLGDLGGFTDSILLLLMIPGHFFSSNLLI